MSVKGFKLSDGTVVKYDYSSLDNIITDSTLSVDGVAADAGAVGDELLSLQNKSFDLDELDRLKLTGLSGTAGQTTDKIAQLTNAIGTETSARMAADASLASDIAVERARISNIVAGTTPGSDELVDVRVGDDGVTYSTAGDAVRGQFGDLKQNLESYFPSINKTTKTGYKVSQTYTGVIVISNYSVAIFEIEPGKKYTIKGSDIGSLEIGLSSNAFVEGNTTQCQSVVFTEAGVTDYSFVNDELRTYLYITEKSPSYPNANITVTEDNGYMLKNIAGDYVIPEMFGAVGDGVNNDTYSFQKAIVYAMSSGKPLRGNPASIYGINYALNINITGKFDVDLCGATIKANASMQTMLNISKTDGSDLETVNTIKNVIFDNNSKGNVIDISQGHKITFDNLSIINCKNNAFKVQAGSEIFLQNSHIECVRGNSTGINITTSDCHFSDIVIIDATIAINNGGTNFYERVHAWNTQGDQTGTTFFAHNGGLPQLSQCQCDTYETGYLRTTDKRLSLVGCTWYMNSNLYTGETTPVIFKFAETARFWQRNVSCVDCTFDALNTETDFCNYHEHMINLVGCWTKGTINYFKAQTSLTLLNNASDTGLSYNENLLRYKDDIVTFNIQLKTSDVTIGSNPVSIGQIKNSYWYPTTQIIVPCLFWTYEWGTTWVNGYLFINPTNGIVQVKANTSGTYEKIYCVGQYELPQVIYNG